MSDQHAELYRPSAFAAMVQCPGSLRMQRLYPEDGEHPTAKDGTAAHWAASQTLTPGTGGVAVGQIAPNGVMLTEEMIEAAELYAEEVTRTLEGTAAVLHVEETVALPMVHPASKGTPDARVFLTPRLLYVWDFKFGFRYVDPFENWQLIGYASGCLSEAGNVDPATAVVLKIVQPRSFHRDGPVREWKVFARDLAPYVERLRVAAEAAARPDAPLVTGDACEDCTARHACPALQARAYQAAEASGQAQPLDMAPEAMGLELRKLMDAKKRLDARVDGLNEQALAMVRRGDRVPYFSIEQGQGKVVWAKPIAEVISVGAMFDKSLAKPQAAITPKQAISAGMDAAIVATYSQTQPGPLKLVPDNLSTARKVFK